MARRQPVGLSLDDPWFGRQLDDVLDAFAGCAGPLLVASRTPLTDLFPDTADVFYRNGGAYFRGIWAQAAEGPPGQQAILEVLADGPATEAKILARTGASPAAAALRSLESHDVIVAVDEAGVRGWRCTVELMRRWLGRLGDRPTPATPAAGDG